MTNLHLASPLRLTRPLGPKVWPHHTTPQSDWNLDPTSIATRYVFSCSRTVSKYFDSSVVSLLTERTFLPKCLTGDSSDASISHWFCGPKWVTHVRWSQQWSHCGPLFVQHLQKDIWTRPVLSCFQAHCGGTKGSRHLTISKSLSIMLFARCLTWRQRGGRGGRGGSALCWKSGEASERAQMPTRESQLDTRALWGVRSWRSGSATMLLRKSLGKGQDGDDRLHAPSSSATLPLWWHWEEAMTSFRKERKREKKFYLLSFIIIFTK